MGHSANTNGVVVNIFQKNDPSAAPLCFIWEPATFCHMAMRLLLHGTDLFHLVPVEPCTPRFGPLFNAASQTVFDVSLFCRTCVVFLQEHKLTLLRCPGECQTQGFPSLHGVKGRHSILHLVGNMISYDFT